jgi:peptidyl-prolyl cis-trans isomerase D
MLDLMRKHAKSWIMKVLLFIIIIVFVLYFGSMSGRQKAEMVATIDGKIIAVADVQREYENLVMSYERMYGVNLNPEMLKRLNLKQKALDNLIDQAIILKKAEQYKIKTTDEEVTTLITANPSFQINGVFDERAYQYALRNLRMSPEEFEVIQKKMLTAAKLEDLITDGVQVSDQEVEDIYKLQNEKININYIKLSPSDFRGKVNPSTAQLEDYYKSHQNDFRISDQVQIKYMAFLGKDYTHLVNVPRDDIQNYYDSHKSQWTKPGDKTLPLSEVENKIVAELKQIGGMHRAGDDAKKAHDIIYQKENFDAYAAQNRLKINMTDFFTAKNPPSEFKTVNDFNNIVFGLEKNEISKIISTDDGYYLFMLAAKKPAYTPAFKDIERDVTDRYSEVESQKLCSKTAEDLIAKLKKGESLQTVAQEANVRIAESGLFLPRAPIPQVGSSQELSDALFQLSENKPYGERAFPVNGQYLIIRLKERSDIDDSDFLAQKDQLKKQLVRVKKMEMIRSWIEAHKATMEKEGQLKIKKEAKDL